ncbi:hypothetical protein KP509_01G041300 [Ceratopteris richardii]|uniref:Uncharacterized protein n=1 Tax=Ceratopteris richardii TaxID=49495 RepID=A0A8T2VKM0_CERRI|nr:hypothetical protein KP509_01G041300 [Ceratopteris richardii]
MFIEKDFGEQSREKSMKRNRDEDKENEEPIQLHERENIDSVATVIRSEPIPSRKPLVPKLFSMFNCADIIRKPFKSPCPGRDDQKATELIRRLNARKRFVPWGSSGEPLLPFTLIPSSPCSNTGVSMAEELPPCIEPLVLWEPEDHRTFDMKVQPIVVDPRLVQFLRPHQRDGVKFLFECVSGLREFSKSNNNSAGCILADDMGLGKTLQSIAVLWTMLKQGFDGSPMAKRVLIVTPTSLVGNWESEIKKWLAGQIRVMALCESTREDVISGISSFLAPNSTYQVLILSYETFRMHASRFHTRGVCDLLICDEAHRLKNDQTCTNKALAALHCHRRVLLSGTPMQNDLEEFFAMVNFANPGILGNAATFRRYFEAPIIVGREPDASEEEKCLAVERSAELSHIVNQFILRRTNALLSNHLPPKIIEIVCCKLTDVQEKLYQHFIHSKNVRKVLQDDAKRARVLSYILALKKLCNHPKLIYDTVRAGRNAEGFEDCLQYIPAEMFSGRNKSWTGAQGDWISLSGKMSVLSRLLEHLRKETNDRIVLVSNYTETLELFAQLCRERNYPYLKLDGTTSMSKRQKLVQKFNDPAENEFVFLLSSKAGGCGLNLIGGNRLVLFDPDWNPANDKQAAARVWRDGQRKRVFIYRFLTSGTIEEKVFERQLSKEGLQKVVENLERNKDYSQGSWLSSEELKDLFSLNNSKESTIHDNLHCKRCGSEDSTDIPAVTSSWVDGKSDIGSFASVAGCLHEQRSWERQIGAPLEEDLRNWAHHQSPKTVPDGILQIAAGNEVSFVFTCQVEGRLIPSESTPAHSRKESDGHFKGMKQLGATGSGQECELLPTWSVMSWPSRNRLTSQKTGVVSIKLQDSEYPFNSRAELQTEE